MKKKRSKSRQSAKKNIVKKSRSVSVQQTDKDFINSALKLFSDKDYDKLRSFKTVNVKNSEMRAILHNVMGASYSETSDYKAAIENYEKALHHFPNYPEALNNLGVARSKINEKKTACQDFKKAIAINDTFAPAYINLGRILTKEKKYKAGISYLIKASKISGGSSEAFNQLGIAYLAARDLEKAAGAFKSALNKNSKNYQAWANLAQVYSLQGQDDLSVDAYKKSYLINPSSKPVLEKLVGMLRSIDVADDPDLLPIIESIVESNIGFPTHIAVLGLRLLKKIGDVRKFLDKSKMMTGLPDVMEVISEASKYTLLLKLMKRCPLPDIEFEAMLTNIRLLLLKNYKAIEMRSLDLNFYAALSIQCYLNEYVYRETKAEGRLLAGLESELKNNKTVSNFLECVFVLSCYRALDAYPWCSKLELHPEISDIFKLQVEEPRLELEISKNISRIGIIDDKISETVKLQYEQNPYPRWRACDSVIQDLSINDFCDRFNLKKNIPDLSFPNPSILVAGCGTGQHPIISSQTFSNAEITAIDFSTTSIAYAERKSRELDIDNVSYYNCDILNVERLDKKFDLIECYGVLHHMSDPKLGWRKLYNQLNYGGYMGIGLYSHYARQHISKIRLETKKLRSNNLGLNDIRKLRHQLILSDEVHHRLALGSGDFYSVSSFRDLLLHTHERQFTIPEIETHLKDLGLVFCGFTDQNIVNTFRTNYALDSDIYDLKLWHDYERQHPWTFIRMYQFWCQRT